MMRVSWQPETSTYAHESICEDPLGILRDAVTMATGGKNASMRASTKISALMSASTKIRSNQMASPVVCMPYESSRR